VVLEYSWRSVVYSMGKEHGQNRGPTMYQHMIYYLCLAIHLRMEGGGELKLTTK
jgi:hypothetical protein